MEVSFPHTQHADSENSLGEVSLQKPDIMVCCNSREGGSGGNAFFCKDFCTATRFLFLKFSPCFSWYFLTAIKLDNLLLFSFTSKSIFSKIDTKFEQEKQI